MKEWMELGFNVLEEGFVLPKLKDVNSRFRTLALQRHSDKGGDDAEFVKLFDAWKAICTFYNNMTANDVNMYRNGME